MKDLNSGNFPLPIGLYDPHDEHSSCGVGFVANIKGMPSREVIDFGIQALKNLRHRGAVDADGKTGDGAGVLLEIPQDYFHYQIHQAGHVISPKGIAIGMLFLPRQDFAAQEQCRVIVESEILRFGFKLLGWRQVPINTAFIGEKAASVRPEIEQVMIDVGHIADVELMERQLFLIRRRIEKEVFKKSINDFYICSFSCRHIVYKGMFLAEQVANFYPDLADESFISSFIMYHQRYSTNTFPKWSLAQPFRNLAHNGEINTLRGNINWIRVHETRMSSEVFGSSNADIMPIIQPGSSDSGALDQAFEVLIRAGREAPLVKSLLIPEAWQRSNTMDPDKQSFYEFCNALMRPWDGPAAITATDGNWIIAGMDRSGLRPLRYSLTTDDLLVVGSETGLVKLPAEIVKEKGRVGPGEMIGINFSEEKFYSNECLKDYLIQQRPYKQLVAKVEHFVDPKSTKRLKDRPEKERELFERQILAGYTQEAIDLLLIPMIETGKEAVGSMGDDTPLAVLSEQYRGLHHYFRQNFAQVTNPPIDPIRERDVMSLTTRFGNLVNVLDDAKPINEVLVLASPIISNAGFKSLSDRYKNASYCINTRFDPRQAGSLQDALENAKTQAEKAVKDGKTSLVLSDYSHNNQTTSIPMVLAVAAVHQHLIATDLRSYCSINVQTGEGFDVHSFAVLIGAGATTVNPYLCEWTIEKLLDKGYCPGKTLSDVLDHYYSAIDSGLLKIMSKVGISDISSYRGGYNFEALGLSRSLVDSFFPGMPSRISGIGMRGIQEKLCQLLELANEPGRTLLPIGGLYRYREEGEAHSLNGNYIHQLQSAVNNNSFKQYMQANRILYNLNPINLRDLLEFKSPYPQLDKEEVESITSIRKKFVTPGMSLGAISPEAHKTLNIAMNRIGAKSVSGEGGEDPSRYYQTDSGDNANSKIKQVASGRFGVTAEYLNQCHEIEIKVAQGAKPGEGGQLPGFKVTDYIAKLRHATPGVTLISPPPHHDIYSIEDLAQLIYDLKQINPFAKVCVKLVARSGVGTIAAGVAKAKADVILISGHSGGTGASPRSSISYAGLPWEMGLAEAHQVLTLNGLRDRVKLRVDGGIKTGKDIVIAAMLGAEEYGIGTASLIAMGCLMVRQCHSNVCPVGICTQIPKLRDKFQGTPEKVIRLFTFIAEEVKNLLADLGVREIKDLVGRTDLLKQVFRGYSWVDDLDLNPLLINLDTSKSIEYCKIKTRNEVDDTLDKKIIEEATAFFDHGEKVELAFNIRNTHRSVGTRLSSMIIRNPRLTPQKLVPNHITLHLRGTAGQSLGAFGVYGLKIVLKGDANDYVGKGLSGAKIVIRPYTSAIFNSHENSIIGNTVLYGATSGVLFASGRAGDRFAVRNSGATAVIEGCGDNGCEYMTGGEVVILGEIGKNFAAGMTGGSAFVYDKSKTLSSKLNDESVICAPLKTVYWQSHLHGLISEFQKETGSLLAEKILNEWEENLISFSHIVPKEMLQKLIHPLVDESSDTSRRVPSAKNKSKQNSMPLER